MHISCSNIDKSDSIYFDYLPKEADLLSPEEICMLNDSFVQIQSCDFYNDYLVLLDISLSKIYVYKNFELQRTIGSKGEAPGEFLFQGIGSIKFTSDGNIAVYDPILFRIQFFTLEGELINSVKVEDIYTDFGVYGEFYVFSPLRGNIELSIYESIDFSELLSF